MGDLIIMLAVLLAIVYVPAKEILTFMAIPLILIMVVIVYMCTLGKIDIFDIFVDVIINKYMNKKSNKISLRIEYNG